MGTNREIDERRESRAHNMVLPKAGLTQYFWANGSNVKFLILFNGSAENPRLRQYLRRYA